MLVDSLRFPLRGGRGDVVETLAVGGGLHLLATFLPVVPLLLVVGYLVRVLAPTRGSENGSNADDDPTPPMFREFRRLLHESLGGSLVMIAYLLVPTVVLLVTLRGFIALSQQPAIGVGLQVTGTVVVVLALAFVYPLPAALAAYGRTRRLRAAFRFKRLRSQVIDGRYFVAWTIGISLVGIALALTPVLNRVALGFFVMFYAETAAAAAWRMGLAG